MLVLGRRIGETIIIGDGTNKIEISILNINKFQVKIGIDAPRFVPVHRKEIYNKIQEEKNKDDKSQR